MEEKINTKAENLTTALKKVRQVLEGLGQLMPVGGLCVLSVGALSSMGDYDWVEDHCLCQYVGMFPNFGSPRTGSRCVPKPCSRTTKTPH